LDNPKDNKLITASRATSANSDFFAYNIVAVEKGKGDFRKLWGNRKLEDNWRTSKEREIILDEVKDEKKVENVVEVDLSEDEYKRLLADVPFTVMQKEKYREEIKKALFDLGKQYRDNLQNYAKSIATLEKLNERFPEHGDKAEAYYYLALNYIDIGDKVQAKKYQDLILNDFKDTKFAKIISDPNYGESLLTEKNRIDSYYDQTYELFKKEQFEKVQTRIKNATETFGESNKLVAKFALLNAMCLGSTSGKDAYIKGLQEVITRYPRTPEETKAKEIMRFLGGDKAAFNNVKIEEVDNIYQLEDDKRHYIAVVLFTLADSTLQNAMEAISDYNKEFHSLEYLQLGDNGISQNEETQEIIIRSFDNRAKAMEYYYEVVKDKEKFIPSSVAETYIMAITQANNRKLIQARTHRDYQVWFENKYLNPNKK
jgi:tetratricopeptide (TPR) repeat protein